MSKLFADERCREAISDFITKTELVMKRRSDDEDRGGRSVSSQEYMPGEGVLQCRFVCFGIQTVPKCMYRLHNGGVRVH